MKYCHNVSALRSPEREAHARAGWVHVTGGILRHFRALSTPEHAASRQSCSQSFVHARPPVTQTVGRLPARSTL